MCLYNKNKLNNKSAFKIRVALNCFFEILFCMLAMTGKKFIVPIVLKNQI